MEFFLIFYLKQKLYICNYKFLTGRLHKSLIFYLINKLINLNNLWFLHIFDVVVIYIVYLFSK